MTTVIYTFPTHWVPKFILRLIELTLIKAKAKEEWLLRSYLVEATISHFPITVITPNYSEMLILENCPVDTVAHTSTKS